MQPLMSYLFYRVHKEIKRKNSQR